MKFNRRQIRRDSYTRLLINSGAAQELRLDANETAAFARQLEDIDAQLYRVVYPENKGTLLVPVRGNINPGADEYTYRSMDRAGRAKRRANHSTDYPRVDIQGREDSQRIENYGASYGYSFQDMRRARMLNMPVDAERAFAARAAVDTTIDEVICVGDSEIGVTGFANNADVALVTPTTGSWLTATADQILADLQKMERAILTDSKEAERPDTLAIAPSRYAVISTKPLGTNSDKTILDFYLKNSQGVRNVESWHRLETADAGGTGPRLVMYRRDPAKLEALVPILFEQFPPEQRGMDILVNCEGRCGGVVWRYPGSGRYMDGC